MSYKIIIKKTFKILLYALGSIVLFLCLFLIFVNLPAGRRVVKNKVQSYLQQKLNTKVTLGSIDYSLPQWVELNNVYIEDQRKDTLLFGEKLMVNISMLKLIWGNTDIKKVDLKNIFLNVKKGESDSAFNYQFVIDAFSGSKPKATSADTTALKINLDRLLLDHVVLRFADNNGGTDIKAGIQSLDVSLNKFQPDRVDFEIKDFVASGIDFFMTTYKESVKEPYLPVPDDKIDKQGYGLNMSANNFNIRDANVIIENKISGMYYANDVKHLQLSKTSINLYGSIATADKLLLDSSFIQFINPKKLPGKTEPVVGVQTTDNSWVIKANQILLKNNNILFDDNNLPKSGGLDLGHLNVKNLSINIGAITYSEKRTEAQVKQLSFKDSSGFKMDSMHVIFLMTDSILSAKELYVKTPQSLLQNFVELKFDSLSGITKDPRNSLVSAIVKNSTIAFNDLYLLVPSLKNAFPPEQFANNTVYFNTELSGNLAQIYLPYLQVVGLSGTRLNAHGTLYNLTDADKFYYDLYIEQSSFKKSDILKFVPPDNKELLANIPALINLRGHIKGNKENFVSDIVASGKGMAFNGIFSMKDISNPQKMRYDFVIRESSFDKSFIEGIIPSGTLPPEINLPDKNNVRGILKGNVDDLVADLQLGGSYGLITVKGFIKNAKDKEKATYDLLFNTNNYEIGKLIKQDSILGTATGLFILKGTGFNYKTMRSDITASVKQLQYKKYNYQNATIAANLNSGLINSKGSINDPNLKLQYDIKANVQNEYPSVNGFVHVDTAQLYQLNLYKDTLNFSLTANIGANSLQPRQLDINTVIDSVRMRLFNELYLLDSVSLIATSANGRDSINFYAPFATMDANGTFDYDKIADAVVQYVNRYYTISDSVRIENIPDQQIVFKGAIKKHPLLTAVVPGLKTYKDINFEGGFTSANVDSALNLNVAVPYVAYDNYVVRNGAINIASKNERLNYNIRFDTLNYSANTFYGTTLNGSAAHDSLLLNVITQDNNKKDWFGLKASLFAKDQNYIFSIKDSLLLNYQRWNIDEDNYLNYSPQGLIVHNFSITSDTAKIFINSRQEIANSPIDIAIDNFNLKSISSIVNNDTIFVAGILNAKMEVNELNKKLPAFTGELTVNDLAVKQQPIGSLTITAGKQSENNIVATLALTGHGNDISAKGNYYLNNDLNQFDATADIRKLNIATIQGLTNGAIKNASGNMRGDFTVNGKFADPRWKGELNFDTTKFTLSQIGSAFNINNQKIIFDYPVIRLTNFIINDSLNNKLKINGPISVNQKESYDLDLSVNANNFILLNAPKTVNGEVYGFAAADIDIRITGNTVRPDIEGNIALRDKSDITIAIPERNYSKDEGESIVRFIDRDTFNINPPVIPFVEKKENNAAFANFLNYNLNVEVKKQASLTIIIDPVTGDEIKVQGDALLNAGVDPGGHLVLSGNYELFNGYYIFNYQFLQRKFELEKGSIIIFAGEPMQASIDINAVFTVNTSARDLVGNEVGSVDPQLANSFKQKIPFRILLHLTGKISEPDISFDIQMPDENAAIGSDLRTTIENKLAQIRGDESATNKQVFSLLLFGRFVEEESNDFFKGNGEDFSDIARQSVSRFLSSALNEIAGNLIKGVDIDLNLNSYRDYSNGNNAQRTDLNVSLSKTFLDDRLTISLGKNFGVQSQDAAAKANDSYVPDVTIGYKLTKDGKYLLKAYRKNQFEVVMDGYVMETGLGFVLTMDYDKFNELFTKKKK